MKGHIHWAYGRLTYALALPLLVYIIVGIKQELFFVQSAVCDITDASELLKNQIATYVDSVKLYSATSIVTHVLQKFPVIETIKVTRTPNQLLFCDAIVKTPVYTINNQTVTTQDGHLYPISFFEPSLIDQTKKCLIQDHTLLNQPTIALLDAIDYHFFQQYVLKINTVYDAWLYPTHTHEYAVRFTLDQHLDSKIIEAAIKQLPILLSDKKKFGGYKGRIVVDVRFANQLILYREQKGEL
jgi:hypothetical protein